MSECKNGKCEYDPAYVRRSIQKRSEAEIRYAQLWAEIELPKLLRGNKP